MFPGEGKRHGALPGRGEAGTDRPPAEGRSGGAAPRPGTLAEAARFGAATLLALPYDAVLPALETAGPVGSFGGRVLIDCTNAVGPGPVLTTGGGPGAARTFTAATGARVVKAFNHVTPAVWSRTPPVFADGPVAVPLCGDDEEALALVSALAADLGCAPLVAGPPAHADLLEATTAFLIGLWTSGRDPRAMLPPPAALGG
ncbi:NADPH-dependent F420 reductase [Streptomyces sp. NK15101]|uniref:NADPH-dependent F420 reductase n=1 Tax=Streptomyces sp. NK15101 TaxID=2873261 RepID=UPI001CED800E|nr:NADP oxidoreductase [Streptomyces sp. NK15101]